MKVGNPPFNSPIAEEALLDPVWQRWLSAVAKSLDSWQYIETAIDPAIVGANTVSRQTFTIAGLTTQDAVVVNPPDLTAGLEILNYRVTATDTLQITFWNSTGGSINAGSQTYTILAIRK